MHTEQRPRPEKSPAPIAMILDNGSEVELWDFKHHVLDALPPGLSDTERALAVLKKAEYTNDFARELEQFSGLSAEVASILIDRKQVRSVVENMDRFDTNTHKEIAFKLIRSNWTSLFLLNLDKFHLLDQDLFFEVIDTGKNMDIDVLMTDKNIDRFHVDRTKAIKLLTERGISFRLGRLYALTQPEAVLIALKNPYLVLLNPSSFAMDMAELDTIVCDAITRHRGFETSFRQTVNAFSNEKARQVFPKSFKIAFDITHDILDERGRSITDKMDTVKWLTRVHPEGMKEKPWVLQPFIDQLLKLQARTANEAHDPWKTDLNPLVRTLEDNGYIDPSNPKDFELLVEFVKRFGMNNTPLIAAVFFSLHQYGADLVTTELLGEFLGKAIPLNTKDKSLLNELEQKQRWFLSQLLTDQVPKGLETRIGLELLNLIKGTTAWGLNDKPEALIATWKETVAGHPELAKLPEHYVEYKIEVPMVDRRAKTEAEEKDLEAKQAEVLALKTMSKDGKEVLTDLGVFVDRFMNASFNHDELMMDMDDWWATQQDRLVDALYPDFDLEQKLSERKATLTAKNFSGEALEKALAAARQALTKQQDKRTELKAALHAIKPPEKKDLTEDHPETKELLVFMESLAHILPKGSQSDQLFVTLSIEHMRRFIPSEWWIQLEETGESVSRAMNGSALPADTFQDLATFFIDYLSEHYLQPKQEESHTGHTPFSPELLKALESAWGRTQKDPKKEHSFAKLRDKLAALEKGETEGTGKTKKISLVPAKGVMRIFSGDTGDACYTSQHKEFAKGEYPGITAYSFVTNRGTAQERVQGSVLFIETQDVGEPAKKVLLVRANNPRENLLSQVDADKLIQETLNVAIDLAKQRRLDMVVVPLDAVSASSSNRPDVSTYYATHFSTAEKVPLKNEPETNFNGYDNWDPNGDNAAVKIWERTAEEKIAA